MTKNIGIDIVEFEEIKKRLSEKFVKRILSPKEIEKYNRIKKDDDKIRYLAGRFAAKEAYTKVYRTFDRPLNFVDVTIMNDEYGAPHLTSKYRPNDKVLISISHSTNYAIAICQLEEEKGSVRYL